MEEFFHILLHALIDTVKIIPFLLIVYSLIEYLEYRNVFKYKHSKLLNGKPSPVFGALVGSVPQCGFSVVSSELFSEKKISIGALIAVYMATSDEAIPLMLADYQSIPALIALIFTKIVIAILIGYLALFLHKKIFKSQPVINTKEHDHDQEHQHDEDEHSHHENEDEHSHATACCKHDTNSTKFNWKHPIIHCLKITIYIFVINAVMGGVIELVGKNNLVAFLNSSNAFQPLFAVLIGLIPNCAASVVLTELYLLGGVSFGTIVSGLCVNAGLGLMVLFKQNKNKKENLFILTMLIIPSLAIGYLLHFLPLSFLKF